MIRTALRFLIEKDRVTFSIKIIKGDGAKEGLYAAVVRTDGSLMLPDFASERDPERISVVLKALLRAAHYGVALIKTGKRKLPNFFAGLRSEGWVEVQR